jgi:hypothetical protein
MITIVEQHANRPVSEQPSSAAAALPAWRRRVLFISVFVLASVARTWHIERHFAMLGDQIRDWAIALGPLTSLPLVGPATHVGGYTVGPAFYWLLWAIRVVVGPWFDYLPHGGGIGQAMLQSAADVLLLAALWKRTGSVWIALTAVVLLVTAPFDLNLAAVIWNPVVGAVLAKAATALVLLGWHRRSLVHAAVTAAVAWCAVHAYTGAIFVAVGVFAALVAEDGIQRHWHGLLRRSLLIAAVVGALQVPLAVHQMMQRADQRAAMGAVTGSIADVVRGRGTIHVAASAAAYEQAVAFIELHPWQPRPVGWILFGCAVVVAFFYRNDPALVAVMLLPQIAAVAGYAVWAGDLQHYYYLSLMPAAVLTTLLGVTAIVPARFARVVGAVLLAAAFAIVPLRLRAAAALPRLPAYRVLVSASRQIVRLKQPMRAIEPQFALPPTTDPSFIFRILGGRIERQAEWRALVASDGRVTYAR